MAQLSSYIGNNVLKGTQDLFFSLGIRLNTPSESPTPISAVLPDAPNSVKSIFSKIRETYFVGTINDQTLQGYDETLSFEERMANMTGHYKGMMVFAVDIVDGKTITRSEIATLNRAFNRASKKAPAALIVRYGRFLSFSICERTAYQQTGHTGEKPGKVSLLRDIDFRNPHRGHIDILSSMKAEDIHTFDALYKKWLKVFNNDTLTDQFYEKLQNWFFWAVKNVSYPNDIKKDADNKKYNPENVIRLITRLIFVWFLKQKGLVPPEIFDRNELPKILKDFDANSSDSSQYYRAILQNLFFATLNKKIDERGFAFDEGWSKNRSNQDVRNLYRFEKDFIWWDSDNPSDSRSKVSEHVLTLFSHVPYMNNSLFECLDNKKYKGDTYYWDGFSRNINRQATVPNKLFFADEEVVDLTDSYLDPSEKHTESELRKYREIKVHGLINILDKYHFTIEENTPLDIDVALDPELLGKAFEQLLAAFNPETKKTARKSTGSYYTPRPIVQYMVDESIVAYLKRTVPSVSENTVRQMLGYDQDLNLDLSDDQRLNLVKAICNCRILDPACGSGAFPMGILQQLSHLLSRVDADNRYWEETVISRAMEDIQKASHLDDVSQAATKADIQEVFNMSVAYPDYARKLYLIEKCIYGVDIQCIAVQISRLRFFISLLCEQKPTDNAADNFGVRPLPNLELKFVTANTLVKLPNADKIHMLLEDKKIDRLIDELSQVRHNLFVATSATSKKRYLERDRLLREHIAQLSADIFADERQQKIEENEKLLAEAESKLQFAKDNLPDKTVIVEEKDLFGEVVSTRKESSRDRELRKLTGHVNFIKAEIKKLRDTAETGRNSTFALARQLTDWNPYDQNVSSPFFDADWMFGVKDGFDIVIGNPPYVQVPNTAYPQYSWNTDLYKIFFERAINSFINQRGILAYITPKFYLVNKDDMNMRTYFIDNLHISKLALCNPFDVVTENVITFLQHGRNSKTISIYKLFPSSSEFTRIEDLDLDYTKTNEYNEMVLEISPEIIKVLKKTKADHPVLRNICSSKRGAEVSKGFLKSNNKGVPSLIGQDMRRYTILWDNTYLPTNHKEYNRLHKFFENKLIYLRRVDSCLEATMSTKHTYGFNKNIYGIHIESEDFFPQYILCLLNSKLIDFYYKKRFSTKKTDVFPEIQAYLYEQLPIPAIKKAEQQLYFKTANELLQECYDNPNAHINDKLNLIDLHIYRLYGLTYDEVLIVDPETTITREEYENHG